jgi:hypothetical protein
MNSHSSPPNAKARGLNQDVGSIIGSVGSADLQRDLAHADLIRDLAHAREKQRKLFATIVRHVQRRETTGPARDMMEQTRQDQKLCKLLADYEDQSEIVGMMDFVREYKIESTLSDGRPPAGSKR